MGIIEISAPWYNPSAPKCRNCNWWLSADRFSGMCRNQKTKVQTKHRYHNDKACVQFKIKHWDTKGGVLDGS